MKGRLKTFIKLNKILIVVLVGILSIYLIFYRVQDFLTNLSNVFFIAGIICLTAGLWTYVLNVGLFKTFGYMAYKIRFGKAKEELRPMSLAEYTMERMSDKNQRPMKKYFITGIPLIAIALIIALII